eukprot:CAMPEP_0119571558 /NCGR_PEP_ID=MMETSP1352-20130426/44177_1 /TAXON_ID=265584 /ORGANISM="Stauroneis constricta, Strain CCMP1120" /LENGTH=569 /DNA_ID=CAMNT_0007621239 /DNA_START=684 /DNA_END=2393 /DNA_ORIENTATION=+
MAKTRVAVLLKDAVGGKAKSHYQSHDLKSLTERYNGFVKKLKQLISVLKSHNDAQMTFLQSRLAVANHVADMCRDSPLVQDIGSSVAAPEKNAGKNGNAAAPADYSAPVVDSSNGSTYMSIHTAAERKGALYASKYKQHVIDYVIEWEKVITTRVTNGLKKWEQVRVETDHYHKKVETLRQSANTAMSKGKQVDPKSADKLTRNEEKWIQARQTHQKVTTDLCILIDEIVNRSWRDLHPLLIKLTQFDMTTADDTSRCMQQLTAVVANLKTLAANEGVKPQARLSDLQSLDPSILNTRPDGPAPGSLSIDSSMGNLSIENAGLGDPFSPASQGSNHSLDGGSVPLGGGGGGGGGSGYPVPMPMQRNTSTVSRSSSIGSFSASSGMYGQPNMSGQPPPSTLDMISMQNNAAPAPTMDQLQGAGMMVPLTSAQSGSSYNGYAMPSSMGNRSRNASLDGSLHSDFSGALAPPPMTAPPPPPNPAGGGLDPFAPDMYSSGSSRNLGNPMNQAAAATTNPFGAAPPQQQNVNMGYGNNNQQHQQQQFYGNANSPPPSQRPPTGYTRRSSNPFDM